MSAERKYQRELIKRLRDRFPGCVIMKNDPTQIQGIPDLLILFNNTWAMLEVKMKHDSAQQPNQAYRVAKYNEMSFASFINPDNEPEVLYALQQAFGLTGASRVS